MPWRGSVVRTLSVCSLPAVAGEIKLSLLELFFNELSSSSRLLSPGRNLKLNGTGLGPLLTKKAGYSLRSPI